MKTKNAPRRPAAKKAVRTRRASAPAKVAVPTDSAIVFTETTADHIRFFNPGEEEPFSVIHNGPEGSENAANVALALQNLQAQGITVKAR